MQLTKHWAAALDDYVIDLAWSSDGTRLAAASAAGPVWLFATEDGAKQHLLPGHDNGTNAIAFAPGSGALASGGQDGAVKFWDSVTARKDRSWLNSIGSDDGYHGKRRFQLFLELRYSVPVGGFSARQATQP